MCVGFEIMNSHTTPINKSKFSCFLFFFKFRQIFGWFAESFNNEIVFQYPVVEFFTRLITIIRQCVFSAFRSEFIPRVVRPCYLSIRTRVPHSWQFEPDETKTRSVENRQRQWPIPPPRHNPIRTFARTCSFRIRVTRSVVYASRNANANGRP